MPGHMIDARCECGFRRDLTPGYGEVRRKNYVMAYSADRSDLNTLELDVFTARRRHAGSSKRQVIEDPFLGGGAAPYPSNKDIPEGPHRCPQCSRQSLFLHWRGFWD